MENINVIGTEGVGTEFIFSLPLTKKIAIRKNVPQHILRPSAVACDILHLRASAHLRHAGFLFSQETLEFPMTTKKRLIA